MDRPVGCTQDMYSIMRQCWQEQPSSRPTFAELTMWFDKMLQSGSEYLDLSTPLVLNREYFDLLGEGDDRDLDGPIEYGNLHLLDAVYLPPSSQSSTDAKSLDKSPLRHVDCHQPSPHDSSRHQSPAKLCEGNQSPPAEGAGHLTYSSLLLRDSDSEEERSVTSRDSEPRDVLDEQHQLMSASA
ncbi:fibroblast growth factor receptor 1-like [Pollicipes pollicipes]|uniref:fibroblast growth factor receptor 1-like n=1 Tax=Pollicipes pollicipes TaxID=41117 RepID=UPI001884E6CE|nr:fibroblast growth factor receptor 1-like [Pollicipes pollicipes]